MPHPEASVIVPARDAEQTLGRTLAALARQEGVSAYEVIVVDNGSADRTAAIAEGAAVVGQVLRRPRGDGPGAARNAGAAVAAGPALAFIDADCYPAVDWLAAGVAALREAELVQGRVLPDPDGSSGPFDRTLVVDGAHGLFESANLFVARELFERLGGFPRGLEDSGAAAGRRDAPFGEDVVFGWRAKRAGARTDFCDRALAYHEVFPGGPRQLIAERARVAMFPALAASIPELRDAFFHRRYFLSRRSASFDLALAGAALALAASQPLALAAALPYGRMLARDLREEGDPRTPAARAIADAVGLAALLAGSVRHRSLLL